MVRHFETRAKARAYLDTCGEWSTKSIYKKIKGHKNRIKKPYVVCTYMSYLNLY